MTYGRWISGVLIFVALVEAVALALLAAGGGGRVLFGPILINLHLLHKPLWIGLAASVGVVTTAPQSRIRRAIGFVLIAALTALAVLVIARTGPVIITKSDIAVTELYVQLATKGELLVGPYSRFQWHHPGPLYFWLQTPFYALSGAKAVGLYAGALAMNLVSVGVLLWVVLRVNQGPLTVSLLAASLLFVIRDRFVMASPWTAHVPIMASMTFIVLAAAVASGRRRMLPLFIVFGAFLAQTHVALVPLVMVLSVVVLVAIVRGATHEHSSSLWPTLNGCAWLLVALWLLPLVEQLAHAPGNLVKLWRFFVVETGPSHPYSAAFHAWIYALTGAFRPDLSTPYGGHFEPTHLRWGIPVVVAEMLALAIIGSRALRQNRLFEASISFTTLTASCVGLWSITRIRGDILDHEIYWMVPLGAMNLAIVAGVVARSIYSRRLIPSHGSRWHSHSVTVMCALLFVAFVWIGVSHFDRLVAFESSTRPKDADIRLTFEAVRTYLDSQEARKPLFRIDGPWEITAAVLVRLHQSGRPFAVEDKWVPMFTDVFSAHGNEDMVVDVGRAERCPQTDESPNTHTLQRQPVCVQATRLER